MQASSAMRPPPKYSWLAKLAIVFVTLLISTSVIYFFFRRYTVLLPPGLPPFVLKNESLTLKDQDGVLRTGLGRSWSEQRDGIWRIHLEGDAVSLGQAHGLLAASESHAIDEYM